MSKELFEKKLKEDPVLSVNTDFTIIKANVFWDDIVGGPVIEPTVRPIMTIANSEMYKFYQNLMVFYEENPDLVPKQN